MLDTEEEKIDYKFVYVSHNDKCSIIDETSWLESFS